MNTPKKNKFYMPAEWHPHKYCWMQWPYENPNHNSYGDVPSWSHFDFEKGRLKINKFLKNGTSKLGFKRLN